MIPLNTALGLPSRALWYVALRSFLVAAFLLLLGGLFQLVASVPGSCHGALCGKMSGGQVAALLYLYGAVLILGAVLNFKWFSFTVTDRSIAITSGVLARNTNTIRFDRIQDVNTRRDPLHALLGLKSVSIWTASPDQISGSGARRPEGSVVLDADDADWLRDYLTDPQAAAGGASGSKGQPAVTVVPHQGNGGVVVGLGVAAGLVVLAVLAAGQKSAPIATAAENGAAVPVPGPVYVPKRGADGKTHPHLVRTTPGRMSQASVAPASTAESPPVAAAVPPLSDYGIACAIHPEEATTAVRSCADLATGERCTHEGDFPSKPTAEPALLTLVNKSNESVKFFWLDPSGRRKPYGSIPPGAYIGQSSHTGAHWLVSTSAGRCLGVFDAATAKIGIF